MLTLELPLNVFVLLAIIFISAFVGFSLRKRQITKCNLRIAELENEMMDNHNEILELQKEYISLSSFLFGITKPQSEKNQQREIITNKQELVEL